MSLPIQTWATRCRSVDNFIFRCILGRGFASRVHLVVDRASLREMAVKVYRKSKLSPMLRRQVRSLSSACLTP